MVRKVPHVKVVLSAEELNKMTMFFAVLVAVDKRVNGGKKKVKKSKIKSKDQTKITSIWDETCLRSRSFSVLIREQIINYLFCKSLDIFMPYLA